MRSCAVDRARRLGQDRLVAGPAAAADGAAAAVEQPQPHPARPGDVDEAVLGLGTAPSWR